MACADTVRAAESNTIARVEVVPWSMASKKGGEAEAISENRHKTQLP
jgi:hypothetical protein